MITPFEAELGGFFFDIDGGKLLRTFCRGVAQLVERRSPKPDVASSNLVAPAKGLDVMPTKNVELARRLRREHYYKNKEVYIERAKKRNALERLKIEDWLVQYLSTHPCIDCGETDIVVLEFDHRDDITKVYNVGSMRRDAKSLAAVMREVGKCDVRCANCHRRRTATQFGWWKLRALNRVVSS